MLTLIASNNFQGHYADVVLNLSLKGVKTQYPSQFKFKDIGEFLPNEGGKAIIIGFPFSKSEIKAFSKSIINSDFAKNGGVFSHFASWGDELPTSSLHVSYVDEEMSLVKRLCTEVDIYSGVVAEIADSVDNYHTYTFEEKGDKNSLRLKLLSDMYGVKLASVATEAGVSSLNKLIHYFNDEIEAQEIKMKDYLEQKIALANAFSVEDYGVVMLYAEEYVNELSDMFIKRFTEAGFSKVIVLIGKHTRGDDMFSVRVSEGLHAGDIAKKLANGKGKERAATVFLSKPLDIIAKGVRQQLLSELK